MSYLFGDLTPAPFTTSFLEEVRETIEFAAALADADQCIVTAQARREELRRRADEEKRRVDALARAVVAAAERADQGDAGSATRALATELAKIVAERSDAAAASVEQRLANDVRAVEKETLEARADYVPMLQRYLLVRVPPASIEVRRIELVGVKKDERRYTAELVARSEMGLEWSIDLSLPSEGAWSKPVRVEDFFDGLTIAAPQKAGLLRREVKSKETKIDRHFVTRVVDEDGAPLQIELRDEIGAPDGFDLSVDLAKHAVAMTKTGDAEDLSVGPFELEAEDQQALLAFAEKVRADARTCAKSRLASATFDGLPFDGENTEVQPKLVALVSRLADKLGPPLSELARRSRSEEELVLRRLLDDGRREELYLPKSRLRSLLEGLDPQHRDLFVSVETALDSGHARETHTIDVEPPASPDRSEVPRSTGEYVRRDSSKRFAAVKVPAPASSSKEGAPPPLTLEEIEAIATAGDVADAFRQYTAVFASPSFHTNRLEDQRRALKLMIHGKAPPAPTDELRAAYRAAVPALQALVVAHRDPTDYEMLGMSYVALAEPEAAKEMFKKALEIERARDPSSDLCEALARRVSSLPA